MILTVFGTTLVFVIYLPVLTTTRHSVARTIWYDPGDPLRGTQIERTQTPKSSRKTQPRRGREIPSQQPAPSSVGRASSPRHHLLLYRYYYYTSWQAPANYRQWCPLTYIICQYPSRKYYVIGCILLSIINHPSLPPSSITKVTATR